MNIYLIILLAIAAFFIICSISIERNKNKRAIWFVVAGGLCLRIAFALIDPLVNVWDECFHALVAKNLTKHWLMPTLWDDPIFDLPTIWIETNVWLHKQPLFLWQMALSIKLFGNTTFAVRLPSILLSTIEIGIIYDLGRKILNREIAYYASLIYAVSYFPLALVSGAVCNDHNDIAFTFYISASFWAWFNYKLTPSWKWVIAIGLFSGMAILTKWLAGFLVFGGWGLTILVIKSERLNLKAYLHLLVAILVAIIVALPWQLYILQNYYQEAMIEYKLISQHFTHAIEGHGGDWFFYLRSLNELYPLFTYYSSILVIISLVLFYRQIEKLDFRIFIFGTIVFVYVFFSAAATKMVAFTFIVSPFFYLSFGNALYMMRQKINDKGFKMQLLLTLAVLAVLFGVYPHYKDHFRFPKQRNAEQFIQQLTNLSEKAKSKDIVLMNVPYQDAVRIMYYTDLQVYAFIPTPTQLETLFQLNKTPVFLSKENLPINLQEDPRIEFYNDIEFPSLDINDPSNKR